jgi:tagatose 6-phosphate kinase
LGLVVTVTVNAALDRTLHVDELRTGSKQIVESEYVQAGGKGVNVSRVLAGLGTEVRSVVVVGGETGRAIERDLEVSGLSPVAVAAPGESRTCLEIVEARNSNVTQLHGVGVSASEATVQSLLAAVEATLDGAAWLALCGSLPPGCPGDAYLRLLQSARRRGVRVALDASGTALVAGWRGAPDLLRINCDEAAGAIGGAFAGFALAGEHMPGIARLTVVSDGPGAIWVREAGGATFRVTPPEVRACNPIGCGDTMLAGLLATLDQRSIEESLRFATSLAAADAESRLAGRPDALRARELESSIAIERV